MIASDFYPSVCFSVGWYFSGWVSYFGPIDERSLLDTSSVFGMSSPGTSSVPGKRERCSLDTNSVFGLSQLGTSSVSGAEAQLPILGEHLNVVSEAPLV